MNEQQKSAFQFASETTKQLLTLATGIITLTITFTKDIVHGAPPGAKPFLQVAWLCLFFSATCGVWVLMALTGTLEPMKSGAPVSIRGKNVVIPSTLQILSFVIGILCVILFGWNAF